MQHDPRKIIIGGGISGLVWGFYHPEYTILTPESSGESFTRTYMVWLHDSPQTRQLLRDLDLPVKPKKSQIGYFVKHWICDYQSPETSHAMIQKKMTEWDKPIDKTFVPKTSDFSLAKQGGNNYLLSLDVDLTEVIRRLNDHVNIVHGVVVGINDDTITYKEKFDSEGIHILAYDKAISTIAAPFFWKAYYSTKPLEPKEFKCLPITNIITTVKPKEFDDRYEMVYYDDTVPFSRVSHIDGKYALEFTGVITREKFEELYPELPVEDYFVVKQGRIFEEENHPPNDKVTFSGRFAQWKFGITTEHVVAQALNYKE